MLFHEQMSVERGGIGLARLAAEIAAAGSSPRSRSRRAGARSARSRSASIATLQAKRRCMIDSMVTLHPGPRRLLNWPDTLVDEAAFRREQAQLARVWTFLGHTRDVANDGDWFRTSLATRSVFVQRFGNELRAFENSCAHRSFPLRNADKGNGLMNPLIFR